MGVLAAVNLRHDLVADDPMLPARAGAAIREAGVIVRPLVAGAIAVSPPLVVDADDLAELAGGFRAGLDAVQLTERIYPGARVRAGLSGTSCRRRIRPGRRGYRS